MRSGLIISFVFIFLTPTAYSQSWRIDKMGITEGLPQGYVYVIHQDKKGFMWIGTHGGLSRYDGYDFKVFQYSPFDPTTLGDNSVFFLKEDPKTGKFWIGGSSCLNEFNPETFITTRYRYTKKQLEFADGVFINEHDILLACEHDVLLFNTSEKKFTQVPVYDENNRQVSIARVENAVTDKKGNFMIMSKTGIFFYDPATKSCKRKTATSPDFSPFYNYEIFNVLLDSYGQYWIATNKKGLIRFDPSSGKISTLQLPSSLKNDLIRFDIVSEDSRRMIWAGCTIGLFRINPRTMAVDYFSDDKNKTVSLSHPEINAIKEDRNGLMWIGTVGGGINKMIPQTAGFRNFVLTKDTSSIKTGTYLMSLQQQGDDIWFTNIWDQVGKINKTTGTTTLYTKAFLTAGYSWYSEGTIIRSKTGELIVLNGENLYRIEPNPTGEPTIQSQKAPGLFHIHYSTNGKTYYMVNTPVEKTFCRNDTIYGDEFFYDAEDDNNGNIWIGSSKGLIRLVTGSNDVVQYRHDDKDPNSVSSDFIYALETDDHQNIWMAAYNGGLCSYNIITGKFRRFGKEDGLSDNIVYSIEKDNRGNLWFSSNAGISVYNTSAGTFRNYRTTDGLLNNEFNRQVSYKDSNGWLYFGGISGIDYFHPDSIIKNNLTVNLAFTNFRVFNIDYIADNKKGIPVIELNSGDRYISVEFASLNYNDQQKIQYAYRMNNSMEWIKTGYQHILSFSELPIGKHNLHIRSTNSEGIWQDNAIVCTIVIHPEWWQTTWFRLIVAALLAALVIFIIRSYYHRKLEQQKRVFEKQQAVEHERTRIATDMHDDMGAGLSRIKFLSETIGIKKQQQQSIEEDINKIRAYSHDMIDKMGEIVWALNEKNDSLSDLLAYTRAYAAEYLSQNGIHCTVEAPEQFPSLFVSGEFRRNIYLTVKEALHNIVKHAHASHVKIRVDTHEHLFISISDDGIGIDKSNIRPFSNGLTNMKKRMESIGGRMEIENGSGTTVVLHIPLSSSVSV